LPIQIRPEPHAVGTGSHDGNGLRTYARFLRPAARLTPAPKPQGKGRAKKGQPAEPPANDDQGSNEARDDAPTAAEDDGKPVPCAECGETFPSVHAATEHYYAAHGKADEPTE